MSKILGDLISSVDVQPLKATTAMTLMIYIGLSIAMLVDLITGIEKARLEHMKNGGDGKGVTTSEGLRRTTKKAKEYFMPLFVCSCVDVMTCWLISAPVLAMAWGAYCAFCEFKSVIENLNAQDRMKEFIAVGKKVAEKDAIGAMETIMDKEKTNK